MRANVAQKTMDMEARDLNYILPAYVRSYMYVSKNEDPDEIIFPMFESCPHPFKAGVKIPIRYVPALSPEALEITVDGQDVSEVVEEEPVVELVEPEKEPAEHVEEPAEVGDHIEEEKIAEADAEAEEDVELEVETAPKVDSQPPAPGRVPKEPEKPATGSPDEMQSRDDRADRQIAKDLKIGEALDEGDQAPYENTIIRGENGKPKVEE